MDILKYFFKQIRILLLIFLSCSDKYAGIRDAVRDRNTSNSSVLEALPSNITEQISCDSDTNTIYDISDNSFYEASPVSFTNNINTQSVSSMNNTNTISKSLSAANDIDSSRHTETSSLLDDKLFCSELFKIHSEIDSYVGNKLEGTPGCYLLNALEVFVKIDCPLLNALSEAHKGTKVCKIIDKLSKNLKSLLMIVPEQLKTWELILRRDLVNTSRAFSNIRSIPLETVTKLQLLHFIMGDLYDMPYIQGDSGHIKAETLEKLRILHLIKNDSSAFSEQEKSELKSKGLSKLLEEYLFPNKPSSCSHCYRPKFNTEDPIINQEENYNIFPQIQRHHYALNYMNRILVVLRTSNKVMDNSKLSASEKNDINISYQNLHNNSRTIQDLIESNNKLLIKLGELLDPEYSGVVNCIIEDLSSFNKYMYYDNIRFHPELRKVAMHFYHFTNEKYFSLLSKELRNIPIPDDSLLKYPDNIKLIHLRVIDKLLKDIEHKESYKKEDFIAIQYIDTISDAFIDNPVWQLDEIGRALKKFSGIKGYCRKLGKQVCDLLSLWKQLPCRVFTPSSKIPYSDQYPIYAGSKEFIHWKCENEELLKNEFKKELSRMDINSAESCLRLVLNNIDLLFSGEYSMWYAKIFESLDCLYYYIFKKDKEILLSYNKISPRKREKILLEL